MQRIRNIDGIIANVLQETNWNLGEANWDFENEMWKSQEDYRCSFSSAKQEKKSKKYHRYYSKNEILNQRKKIYFQKLHSEWWIHFCPYCGKNTIIHFWVEDDKKFKRLYDIEHFLPRSSYSSLSINPYNRLPACMSCNQRLKLDNDPLKNKTSDDRIFHPYFWRICLKTEENEKNKKSEETIDVENRDFDKKITFVNRDGEERKFIFDSQHGKFFQIANIYLNSEDTFQIFCFIYDNYTKIKDEYLKFKKRSKSIEAFIDYFFASYYPKDEQDILKYSNGKYKKDLIQYMRQLLESWKQTLPDQN